MSETGKYVYIGWMRISLVCMYTLSPWIWHNNIPGTMRVSRTDCSFLPGQSRSLLPSQPRGGEERLKTEAALRVVFLTVAVLLASLVRAGVLVHVSQATPLGSATERAGKWMTSLLPCYAFFKSWRRLNDTFTDSNNSDRLKMLMKVM